MTDETVPASSAEVVQPSTEPVQETGAEGTGASEQTAEQQEADRRASEAGRELAARTKRNQQAAAFRKQFEELQRQNAELTRVLIERTQPPKPEPAKDDAPTREQFQSYEEYVEAKAEWRAAKRAEELVRRQFEQLGEHVQRAQREQAEQVTAAQFGSRLQEYAQKNPGFAEVMQNEDVALPEPAWRALLELEEAPQVMEAMHNDPRIAHALHNMTPARQVAFLGQVAAILKFQSPQVSKAPPPGKPVAARSTSSSSAPSDDDSHADWLRKRNAQVAKR